MNTWLEKSQKISRILVVLFLFILLGVAFFLALHKFFPASPLKMLNAEGVQMITVIDEPEVLKALLSSSTGTEMQEMFFTQIIPGAQADQILKLVETLPENTALVSYQTSTIAAFPASGTQTCESYAFAGLLASKHETLCVLHTSALDSALFETKDGSIHSKYGAQLPDNVSGLKVLLTENLPFEEVVTSALGGVITPETLLARALAAKHFPVMMHITQDEKQFLHIDGHILFGRKSVPGELQSARIAKNLLEQTPQQGGSVLFALSKPLYEAFYQWITQEYGENVRLMAEHVLLTLTEPLTPVGIQVAQLPEISALVTFPVREKGNWQAVFADVDENEQKQLQAIIEDSLTFLYGLSSTATTLPDRTRGVVVTASRESVTSEIRTTSGTTMTAYSADEALRLVTENDGTLLRMSLPAAMSGTVLQAPSGQMQETPTILPIAHEQVLMLKWPLDDVVTVYAGILFLPDRLKFDIALTPRS